MLLPRHGNHHFANVKYGYIALAISLVHYVVLVVCFRISHSRFAAGKSAISPSVIVQIVVWAVLVGLLCANLFEELGENVSTLLKRFGRLSYALVPLDLLLILRPNLVNYLHLVSLHKWLSRFIVLLATIHSVGYLVKWAVEHTLFKIFRLYNFLGVVMFVAFIPLVVLSARFFRQKNYKLFYVVHNVTVAMFVVMTTFHARPGVTPLAVFNVVIVLFQLILRLNTLSVQTSKVEQFTDFILVSLDPPFPVTCSPGSHVRISTSGLKNWLFASHPYTIIYYDNKINLVLKSSNAFAPSMNDSYILTYPFNSFLDLKSYVDKNVSVVVGGSGISFALSILAQYPHKINIIWCVKNARDIDLLEHFDLDYSFLKVFVTQTNNDEESEPLNFEMQEFDTKFPVSLGRPNIPTVLNPIPDLLIACGPVSLVDDCRTFASKSQIALVEESYQM